jgi:hypothetical protein
MSATDSKRLADLLVMIGDMQKHHAMVAEEGRLRAVSAREKDSNTEAEVHMARATRDQLIANKLADLLKPMPLLDRSTDEACKAQHVPCAGCKKPAYRSPLATDNMVIFCSKTCEEDSRIAPESPNAERLTSFMVMVDGVAYVPLTMGERLARILRDTWDAYEACDVVDDEEMFGEERTRVRNALNLWLGDGAWQS